MTDRMIPASDVIAALDKHVGTVRYRAVARVLAELGIDPAGPTEPEWEIPAEVRTTALYAYTEAYERASDPNQGLNPEGIGLVGWNMWATEYAVNAAIRSVAPLFTAEQVQAREQAATRQALHDAADWADQHTEWVRGSVGTWLRGRADQIGGTP